MIVEAAPAKLNLALHVRRRRADGYHEIETLFAFVAHGDVVRIETAAAPSFAITGRFAPALAGAGGNLVLRAVAAFEAAIGSVGPVAIALEKNLPVASGIGGGSADAAATLRALARQAGVAIDDPRLFDAAGRLGADVPACLLGRTAIGTGRGDALREIAGLAGTPALLVNPGVAVSTARVFAGWDGIDRGALAGDSAAAIMAAGRNDLEAPARVIAPEIDQALDLLRDGASLVRMSGSGATCFGLFDGGAARRRAAVRIAAARPDWWRLETALA